MIEKDVYQFKTKIKVGIMWSIYTMNGKINEVDFSLLDDNTLDAYLEGALISTVEKKKENPWEKWNVGLMFDGKEFRGYIVGKDKGRLKDCLTDATIKFINPKYSIVEV